MAKYIHESSISVGFNPDNGQSFFDLLNNKKYRKYIHSYFLSLTRTQKSELYNADILKLLSTWDTFGIPANLLFNSYQDNHGKISNDDIDLIKKSKEYCNVESITILRPDEAIWIKSVLPDIKIHLSVRYFDNMQFPIEELINGMLQFIEYLDVINISGNFTYNDHKLIESIHEHGKEVKFIVNENCILNKFRNYSQFPGCENNRCFYKDPSMDCKGVISKYNWLCMCNSSIYKEQMLYYDIDILKLATRSFTTDNVERLLKYWTSDAPTSELNSSHTNNLDILNNYQTFLEYCKFRSTECKGYCWSCQKCKEFYEKLLSVKINN